MLAAAAQVLSAIRGVKSTAKVGMRTEVRSVTVRGPQARLDLVDRGLDDIKAAGRVVGDVSLTAVDGEDLNVDVQLA